MMKAFEGGKASTQQYVRDRINQKVKNGMKQSSAVFGLKTSIANCYKQKFIDGDADQRGYIIEYMTNTGIYGSKDAVVKYIKKHWMK
jgi:hypothetical protein